MQQWLNPHEFELAELVTPERLPQGMLNRLNSSSTYKAELGHFPDVNTGLAEHWSLYFLF